jgi:Na+/proline symporter/nitrogen-specific signal transduction histidine kinase
MLKEWVILAVSLGYLALLFGVAYYGDKRADLGRSIISNPYIYTLSIAVYCTAWTFYGSVGRAASTGVGFLPIYLGPTLMVAMWWMVLRKIIRIAKVHRITSIADFIGSRYGKSALLGGLVSIIAVVGIMPYISLQLKAVSTSFNVVRRFSALPALEHTAATPLWSDTALYVALMMAAFTILFGTRHIDVAERHEGMVAAIALESLVKLLAFLSVGVFVTFGVFEGPGDLFARAALDPELARLMSLEGVPGGATSWFFLTFLSMFAILFLPRQFQVAVIENVNEEHVRKAVWLFPLYLFVINLFVLPIAFGGLLHFPNGGVDPDTFVLTIPMAEQQEALALFVFLGGLSAATGMVIVATIALSTMVCNDVVMPVLLRVKALGLTQRSDLGGLLLGIRRGAIVVILLLGFVYFRLIGESYALVTIGLVSFVAAAQFAPSILFGIYWQGASRAGALAGLTTGFCVWIYTLMLPAFAKSGWLSTAFIEHGLFGLELLKPYQLLGLEGLDTISHAVFWSLLFNAGCLVGVSLFSRQSPIERMQAAFFVDVFRQAAPRGETQFWRGTATVSELFDLCARFLGPPRASDIFTDYAREQGVKLEHELQASPRLVNLVERQLAGAIGSASARVMVSSTVKGEALRLEDVMQILDETSQMVEHSRQLEQKSVELEAATKELRAANERLHELDRLKDEFVFTISHELRTPLTSIRAFSEILHDNPDLDVNQREEFLATMVKETERLTRLVNELLDLARIEAGRMDWRMEQLDLRELIRDAVASVGQLFEERRITLTQDFPDRPMIAQGDHDRLMRVLINLLSNANKFCRPNTGHVVVRLSEIAQGGYRCEVIDNGPGIPKEQLELVFERFQQVSDPDSGKPRGSGLGLTICQRIIEHHGGRIWASSVIGEGTTMTFELPRAEVSPSGHTA